MALQVRELMEDQAAVLEVQDHLLVLAEVVMYQSFLHHKEIQAEVPPMDHLPLQVEVAVAEVILLQVRIMVRNLAEGQEELELQAIL